MKSDERRLAFRNLSGSHLWQQYQDWKSFYSGDQAPCSNAVSLIQIDPRFAGRSVVEMKSFVLVFVALWGLNFASFAANPVDTESFDALRTRAEKGDVDAERLLGTKYYTGDGVTKDQVECVKWFRKAAEQGDALAQFLLGLRYAAGEGVTKDPVEAAKWYSKSAEAGNAEAQAALGFCYLNGDGVTKDSGAALNWLRKGAESDATSARMLSLIFSGSLPGSDIAEDPNESSKWLRKAAELGDARSAYDLGNRYAQGIGMPKDNNEALKWFRKAAEKDGRMAFMLGMLYEGRSLADVVPKDEVEALAWFYIAVATKRSDAVLLEQTTLEKRISPKQVSAAMERAKEIAVQIRANNVRK